MKRALLPIVVIATAVSSLAQDSVTLRYNLKQGKVYRYTMQMNMGMEGGPMSMDMKMNMVGCVKIKEIVDGFINTVNYYDYMRVSSSQPGMDQMLGGQESELKKVRISQQFDLLGNPKGEPTVSGGAAAGQVGSLGGLTGSSALGIAMPKEPVTVGKTWEQNLDLGKALAMLGEADSKNPMKITYTVKSFGTYRGRKSVTIDMAINGKISMGAPAGQGADGSKVEIGMEGTGSVVVDQATGLTLKSDTNIGMDLSIEGLPAGGPQNIKQKIRVASELLDLASL